MKMLEIDEKEFINLDKVIRIKIKESRITGPKSLNHHDNESIHGYALEFELDNSIFVTSKDFKTIDEAKMWLFDHNK